MLAVCLLCTQEVSNFPRVQTLCTALWNSLVSFRLVLQHWDRLPTSQIILQLGTCFSIGVHATVHTPCDFVNFCHMYYSTFDLAAEVAKMRAGWGDMRQSHVCPWELVFSLAGLRSTAFGLHTCELSWVHTHTRWSLNLYSILRIMQMMLERCWREKVHSIPFSRPKGKKVSTGDMSDTYSNITTKCPHMCYCDTMWHWDLPSRSVSTGFFFCRLFLLAIFMSVIFTSSWVTMRWRCLWRWIQARKLARSFSLSKAMRIRLRSFQDVRHCGV